MDLAKNEALRMLANRLQDDLTLPLRESNLVFGEGDIDAQVLFIGEAPGMNENLQKRPFVGRGGQLLNKMLEHIGWRREQVYITNIVKRRPPDNRDPFPEEIAAYKPYLTEQIRIINPKIIVTLGRFAMNYFLPMAKITRDQGKAFQLQGKLLVPILHPAAALRGNEAMAMFRASFEKLPLIIKKRESLIAEAASKNQAKDETSIQEKLF